MSDLISRQDVEEIINDVRDCISVKGYWAILERMRKLPSAEPRSRCIANIHLSQEQLDEAFEKVKVDILSVKPKTGKWIGGELGECSVCGHYGCASDIWDRCTKHYCPNCGIRMLEDGGEDE